MSRPVLLVFLLLLIVFTSRVEWNQQIVNEVEANPTVSRKKQDVLDAQESVKEKGFLFSLSLDVEHGLSHFHSPLRTASFSCFRGADLIPIYYVIFYIRSKERGEMIILSQEKSIQKLNKLVQSLQEQLVQCRVINGAVVDTSIPFTELLNELEQQQILEA